MNFATDYEIQVAHRRIEDMRLEIAANRIGSANAAHEGAPRPFNVVALFDAAVARASEGAVRRNSQRNGGQRLV